MVTDEIPAEFNLRISLLSGTVTYYFLVTKLTTMSLMVKNSIDKMTRTMQMTCKVQCEQARCVNLTMRPRDFLCEAAVVTFPMTSDIVLFVVNVACMCTTTYMQSSPTYLFKKRKNLQNAAQRRCCCKMTRSLIV